MSDLTALPPMERAKRYRELATQARADAQNAKDGTRDSLLNLAISYERLAERVDAIAAHALQAAEEAVQPVEDEKLAALKGPPTTEPDKL